MTPLSAPAHPQEGNVGRAGQPGTARRSRSPLPRGVRGQAAYALADQIVFSFGNMVVAALISRHCSLEALGVYILTQRAMDVLIQVSNGVLWTPLTFRCPELTPEMGPSYQGSVLFWQVSLCLLFSGVFQMLAVVSDSGGWTNLHETFRPLIFTGGGILFREFTRRMYFAHLRLKEAFWTDFATVALQVAGVLELDHLGRLDVNGALGMLWLGASVVSVWWMVREWTTWQFDHRKLCADLAQDLKLGRWLLGGNVLALVSAQCNPWLLNGLLGSASVGTYSICESLVNIPRAALTSLQNIMGPTVAQANHTEGVAGVRGAVRRLNQIVWAATSIFGFLVFVGCVCAARLIYGYAPEGTRLIACLLAVNLAVFAGTLPQMYGLTALGRADGPFLANLAGVLLQLAVSAACVRRFATPGAAVSLLLGNGVVLVVRHWLFSRATDPSKQRQAPPSEGAVQGIAV